MIYIYDILLNLNKSRIYTFYEWDPKDEITHIKKIPLYKVDSNTLEDFFNYKVCFDESYLKNIYNKCETFKKKNRVLFTYCALFTDGLRVLAISICKDGQSEYKSRLLLDEEEEVLDLSTRLNKTNIQYRRLHKVEDAKNLTRKEEVIKKYLINELDTTYTNKDIDKMQFIYLEYFNKIESSLETMYQMLKKEILENLNPKEKNIYEMLKPSQAKTNKI